MGPKEDQRVIATNPHTGQTEVFRFDGFQQDIDGSIAFGQWTGTESGYSFSDNGLVAAQGGDKE